MNTAIIIQKILPRSGLVQQYAQTDPAVLERLALAVGFEIGV